MSEIRSSMVAAGSNDSKMGQKIRQLIIDKHYNYDMCRESFKFEFPIIMSLCVQVRAAVRSGVCYRCCVGAYYHLGNVPSKIQV